jgi:hypothetical protein
LALRHQIVVLQRSVKKRLKLTSVRTEKRLILSQKPPEPRAVEPPEQRRVVAIAQVGG